MPDSSVSAVHLVNMPERDDRALAITWLGHATVLLELAGDTDVFDQMADLCGLIDVALLPISGWGPRFGPGHLDPQRAAWTAGIIAPAVAIPIHWGTLARPRPADRPADPAAPAREFAAAVAARTPDVRVGLLAPGETARLTEDDLGPERRQRDRDQPEVGRAERDPDDHGAQPPDHHSR